MGNSDPARIGAIASLIGTETFDDALARFLPEDLAAMRPCFSAIAHGCAAGRHQDAYREVYRMRVRRGDEWFMFVKLGAANAELALLASFYDAVWTTPAHQLSPLDRARILGYTGFALRALGRMHEAAHLFAASLKSLVDAASWRDAAICASAKSELRLCLGDIREAIGLARTSVIYADQSGAIDHRVKRRMALGDALHQAGHMREAQALFEEAIVLQGDAALRTLYSLWSYRYCDFMLAQGQAQFVLDNDCHRGVSGSLLDLGLEDLIAGRAHAALALAAPSADGNGKQRPALAREHLNAAVDRLRRAFNDQWVPKGLIARAAFLRACGEYPAASVDLAEAHEIAARGEMRLHLTDFRLEAARLALAQRDATGDNAFRVHAENHIMAAANLIACSGYKRRLAELEALRACLSGAITASQLAPDCDAQGRAIWHNLDEQ